MNNFKKIFSITAAIFIIFALAVSTSASATLARFEYDAAAEKGTEITLNIITNEPIVTKSGSVSIEYDANALDFVKAGWTINNAMIATYDSSTHKGAFACSGEIEINDTIFSITFLVKESSSLSSTTINASMIFIDKENNKETIDLSPANISIVTSGESAGLGGSGGSSETPAPETDRVTEAITEVVTETVTESATEAVTEAVTESVSEIATEPEAKETVIESVLDQTEPESEIDSDTYTQPQTEITPETKPVAETAPANEFESEVITIGKDLPNVFDKLQGCSLSVTITALALIVSMGCSAAFATKKRK